MEALPELGLMAVQYHPESSPGPHDSLYLFREFRLMAGEASRLRSEKRGAKGGP